LAWIAERTGEQGDRQQRDHGEHQREVPEHGVLVVELDRTVAGDADHGGPVAHRVADGAHWLQRAVDRLGARDRQQDRGAGAVAVGGGRVSDGGDPRHVLELCADRSCVWRSGEDFDRGQRTAGRAAREHLLVGVVGLAALGVGAGRGLAGGQAERGDDQHD
jgi:hypothetical protein